MIHPIHFNKAQIRSMIIDAPEEYDILARGTGKTKGIIAPKSARYLDAMPRAVGVFVGATFQQILTRTLPPLLAGWEMLGYYQNVHYTIGIKPPQKWRDQWRWVGPYHTPLNFDYFICWWNGAGVQLISQDRSGSSNGVSIDWIMGDEAKLLNEKRLKEELFPANRGLYKELADNPHHHGKTFTSDMPVGTSGRWLLDKANDMDPRKLQAIISLEMEKYELQQSLEFCLSGTITAQRMARIASINKLLNLIKRRFVYYHEASALMNIDALGIDYIKEEYRSLSRFEFKTAILNIRPVKVEDGFYPSLDEEKHGYFSYDYHQQENIGYNFELLSQLKDCRKDGDIIKGAALHIAIDYNRRIWPIVTAQPVIHPNGRKELRTLSGLDVLYPESIDKALELWSNYYKRHDSNVVYFWYDHTALNETRQPVRQDVVDGLTKLGWIVIEMYIGKTLNQDVRYTKADDLLRDDGKTEWFATFNRDNCKYLLLSMFQCKAIEKYKGYGKDKKPEHDLKFPAREAPHYSDAWDTLMTGLVYSGLSYDESRSERNEFEMRG